jgi:hypothetical protein
MPATRSTSSSSDTGRHQSRVAEGDITIVLLAWSAHTGCLTDPVPMPRLSRPRLAGRESRSHGTQCASAPRSGVHRRGGCPCHRAVNARAAAMTRSVLRRPEVVGPTRSALEAARWNEQMTRILREGAEDRDDLERASAAESSRLLQQQAIACLSLIGERASSSGQPNSPRGHHRRRGRCTPPEPR